MYNQLSQDKLRAKIIRKGLFSQLPFRDKDLENEQRLFRTVLDFAFYDGTGTKKGERKAFFIWLQKDNHDFDEVCKYAGLDTSKTYAMYLYFMKNYFKDIYQEFTCFNKTKSVS